MKNYGSNGDEIICLLSDPCLRDDFPLSLVSLVAKDVAIDIIHGFNIARFHG